MTRNTGTRFQKGQSGNPAGRPAGSGWVGKARKELQEAWEGKAKGGSDGVRSILLAKAKDGDMAAIRLVAERVCPPIKASEPTAEIDLSGENLTEQAQKVVAAMAEGSIAPGQASQLLQGLGALAKIMETDELMRRLEKLEEKANAAAK